MFWDFLNLFVIFFTATCLHSLKANWLFMLIHTRRAIRPRSVCECLFTLLWGVLRICSPMSCWLFLHKSCFFLPKCSSVGAVISNRTCLSLFHRKPRSLFLFSFSGTCPEAVPERWLRQPGCVAGDKWRLLISEQHTSLACYHLLSFHYMPAVLSNPFPLCLPEQMTSLMLIKTIKSHKSCRVLNRILFLQREALKFYNFPVRRIPIGMSQFCLRNFAEQRYIWPDLKQKLFLTHFESDTTTSGLGQQMNHLSQVQDSECWFLWSI